MRTLDHIFAIAQDVRYDIEGLASRRKSQIIPGRVGSPERLGGWCAIASARLFREFAKNDIDSEIWMWVSNHGEAHVFNFVDDHIVDITATQFHEHIDQPVLILHSKEAMAFDHFQPTKQFGSVKELIDDQKRERWPTNQIAKL